ncbi:autotransporter outer membrane beta-barrel domain-containing protein [Cereibacter changlensis JA139]|uniref:Autotransporter outer membrane beta-barrel domain-containing protein n=2 Tax=Cereibacter changlensis TaxID=402884 RepID=A0A2T4JS53_9RHOB|nr:autotransporter domain-containing protein [Cereibacter changlensis]PTE20593.1 autotransporter outer membrane beta-barrel domain-containing protein [Cereibacter changlensis JA139]PZX56283.1 outer membrane autotransporter protein [Cereibacter changlensis]
MNETSNTARARRTSWRIALLGTVALLPLMGAPARADDSGNTLRLLTLNIWNQYKQQPERPTQLMIPGDYDAVLFQEVNGSNYIENIPGLLKDAGLGTYQGIRNGSSGVISRLPGSLGSIDLPGSKQGREISYAIATGAGGRPDTTIGAVHFDYADTTADRVKEAKELSKWAASLSGPLIMAGDFNAGDVSERGLHSVSQQEFLLRVYTKNPNNSFYYDLLKQYAKDQTALDKFIADWRGKGGSAIDGATVPTGLFEEETYPIAGNTPVTMNVLKKQFMLFQTEAEREGFAPHDLGDGSTTWPSYGEDDTNTWGSWDRVKIDHFLISRPFGKWFALTDDPEDEYLGVIDKFYVTNPDNSQTPLSDHEPVAHEFTWVGPQLERYTGADGEATRLVWGADAAQFAEKEKEFFLTRNNMRTDVYLGQIADADGNPILTDLTLAEKKTLLDCESTDPRFQQAIVDYCIDDHSFIGETLVTDEGTVIVNEDAALGGADATLRLSDGSLRIAGTAMTTLARNVSLEGEGGTIEIASDNAAITASGVFSGTGAFTKSGEGLLALTGASSYTGATTVAAGELLVKGSIASSAMTTVANGAALAGSGTVGNATIASGGTLHTGSELGALKVQGDLTFAQGSTFAVETGAEGGSNTVKVSGTAKLNGSVLALGGSGVYKPSTSYTLLSAAKGLEGSFGSVSSTLAFMDASLAYGETDVSLTLDRNDTAFDRVARSANGRAAATGVESLGMGNAVYDEVVMTDVETANAAFDSLSGEAHAAALAADVGSALTLGDVMNGRSRGFTSGTEVARGAIGGASTASVWAKAYGAWGESGADGVSDADRNAAGTLFGLDGEVGDNWRLGVVAGFGTSTVKLSDSRVEADSYHLGIYGGTTSGPMGLRFGLTHSLNDNDSRRGVTYGAVSETLTASYDSQVTQLFGEASYRIDTARGLLEPFVGLAQLHASTDGFTESGGASALTGSDAKMDTTFATLGLRTEQGFELGGRRALFEGEIGLRHAFGDVDPETTLAFAGGSEFGVTGAPVAENTAILRASVALDLAPGADVSVGYAGAFGDDITDHRLAANLRVKF